MKKIASLILAVMLVLAMAVPAMAEDTQYTITVPNNGRSYEVYQIFTGDYDTTSKRLSNIVWGVNGTGTTGEAVSETVLTELTNVNTSTATDTAQLAVIEKYVTLSNPMATLPETTGDGEEVTKTYSKTVAPGYYLIKDVGPVNAGESYSLYVVEVVDNVTISPKVGKVESNKKVKDINDSEDGSITDNAWQDSADHDIGDAVPFKLTGTVPSNYADYQHYYYAFHDKESAGLTFKANTVKVYVDGKEITSNFEVKTTDLNDGCTFEVVFADLKKISDVKAGSVITVEYESELNKDAVLGSTGNPNEMHLEYSNNPNASGEGEYDDDDNTGETPKDKVIVFTYKVVVDKYADEVKEGNELAGAGFTLYKKNAAGEYVAVGEEKTGAEMITFEWTGLDDGDYKIEETTTPAGYNTIDPIEFTITAEHDVTSDNPALTKLEGGTLFTGAVDTGALSANVVNKSGSTLPETGGMGTTLIYAVGALLVAGAVVVMISKKRAASK